MTDETTKWRARVQTALIERRRTLCEYLLLRVENPDAYSPEWAVTLERRLDEIDAQLADSGPLVKRVMEAVEKAKQSIPKHSRTTKEAP